ncbi:MAG: endolytic transglycosylase MltG [Prevotella sp.]|nr:endolytic transglycosylase MltG [Prevotella sp.]
MITSRKFIIAAATAVVIIIGLCYYYFFSAMLSGGENQFVYIDDDDNIDSVYAKLQPISTQHGMTGFKTIARHGAYADKIRTGRYEITKRNGAFTVFRKFKSGTQSPVSLTIPSVRTADKLADVLSKKLMLDSLSIYQALTDSAQCAKYGYTPETILCMFIPNTYEVYWNITLDKLLDKMETESERFWNVQRQKKASDMGLTKVEVITLASIVDEETANDAEKPMIAGMYYNRLKAEMPLQADPTIKFALNDFNIQRIYHNMLKVDSPYNTYMYEGLPPGPIRIPSVAGIDAVLNYTHHDYLYMCAKEDFSGTHNFAETYEEHLQNAARYTAALNERDIK